MNADLRESGQDRACGKCGGKVTAWPYAVVPAADGSITYFHEGCEPWLVARTDPTDEVGPIPEHWRPAIEAVVLRLVAKDYKGLARDGLVSHTNEPGDDSIGTWIEDYPATLVPLPEEAWAHAERGPWANLPDAWWVVVDLWTAEEGRSDLSLEATVRERDGSVSVKVDNVHVM